MRMKDARKKHPGLTCFREGVFLLLLLIYLFVIIHISMLDLKVRGIPVESIPGLREAGWRAAARQTRVARYTEEPSDPDTLATALRSTLNAVN